MVRTFLVRFSFLLTCLLVLVVIYARFTKLDYSPPGFFVDEALVAAHTVCLEKYGTNCDGVRWPIYSKAWGFGRVGPVYQYLGWAWTSIFGGSIFSLRAMSSLAGLLTPVLVALIARNIAGNFAAGWVFFAALLSPWGFHSSRLAWDPALAPMLLTLAIYLFIKAKDSKYSYFYSALAGLVTVLTFHTYSPVGAQAVILFALLFASQKLVLHLPFKNWLVLGLTAGICFTTIYLADTSLVQGRAGEVGIFGDDPRNPTAGLPWFARVPQFLGNVVKHFEPSYLMVNGEPILRHTVNNFGILSWLDMFAILVAFIVFLALAEVKLSDKQNQDSRNLGRLVILGFIGYLSAAMAAGLTWDSLPHGLRSLGGWPFIALLSGACLAYINRFIAFRYVSIGVASVFIYFFALHYYGQFRIDSAWWFDKDVTDQLQTSYPSQDFASFDQFMTERQYPVQAKRYFDIEYFKQDLYSQKVGQIGFK